MAEFRVNGIEISHLTKARYFVASLITISISGITLLFSQILH
jgi:hypothetical protein